jgi:hypothetical protein
MVSKNAHQKRREKEYVEKVSGIEVVIVNAIPQTQVDVGEYPKNSGYGKPKIDGEPLAQIEAD